VASRIPIVRLCNNTGGSVFAVALLHATLSLTFMLFPVNGSHFNMRLSGLVMALAVAMVTVFRGAKTLARCKFAGRRWLVRLSVALGILGLTIAGAQRIVMPVFRFP